MLRIMFANLLLIVIIKHRRDNASIATSPYGLDINLVSKRLHF